MPQNTRESSTVEDGRLHWDVFVNPSISMVVTSLPPGQRQMVWQPIASTLIYAERDAVLVDPPLTIEQTNNLISWVAASGKNLTTIYSTHGHGDHWFGIGAVLDRFPGARAVATPDVAELMRQHVTPDATKWWRSSFPGQIPDRLVVAQELGGDTFPLEGERLVAVEVGHGDSDHSTCLSVPSIGLVVAGDVAYNDVHQYFVESDHQKRGEWISALDKIESLKPVAAIAGHKRPGALDTPSDLEATRKYIRDFDRIAYHTKTALALYNEMLAIYPERVNPAVLWYSAQAVKPATESDDVRPL